MACFQLIFEAVRSGFDGRVAIDDVAFVERECAVPRMCSFEEQRCGFTAADIAWHHRSGQTSAGGGPRTDHTLETPMGEGKEADGAGRRRKDTRDVSPPLLAAQAST